MWMNWSTALGAHVMSCFCTDSLVSNLPSTLPITDGILVSDSFQTPSLGSNKEVEASAILRKQMRVCSSGHLVSIALLLIQASGVQQKQTTRLAWAIPNRPSIASAKLGERKKSINFGNLMFKKKKKEEEEMERAGGSQSNQASRKNYKSIVHP